MDKHGTSKLIAALSRFERVKNSQWHEHEDGGWSIHLPGFAYDDFSRTGLLDIVKVDRLAQTTTANKLLRAAASKRGMLHQTEAPRSLLLFNVVTQWTFSARLYQRAAVNFPMRLRVAVTNVGKSSFDMQQTYVEDSTSVTDDTGDSSTSPMSRPQEPLALRDSRVALVDSVTRKAAPLSDDIMEDLRAMVTAPAYGIRLPSSIRPPELLPHRTFKCCITVRFDDTDFQGHTNTSSYMRFALECAAQAVQCGFYSSIRDDVGLHRARKTNTIFLSESRVGDRLHVSTWQDEGNQLLLNFAISNSGRLINFAQIEFFDNKTFDPSELFSTHLLAAKI